MPDFFNIARHLTDEERSIGKSVRSFVDARILPTISEHYEKGTFPMELIPEIAELGLLGCNLKGYGCAGLSQAGYGIAMQELRDRPPRRDAADEVLRHRAAERRRKRGDRALQVAVLA